MATLKDALIWAQKNPDDEKSVELIRRIKSGSFDEQAKKEGLDLSKVSPTFISTQVSSAPTEVKQQGWMSRLAGGIAQPFVQLASDVRAAGVGLYGLAKGGVEALVGDKEKAKQTILQAGESGERGISTPVTGNVKPQTDIVKGAGTGLQLAPYIIGGPAMGLAKSVAGTGLLGAIKAGALVGGFTGGLYGAGAAATQEKTSPGKILGGAAFGVATGAPTGAAIGAITYGIGKGYSALKGQTPEEKFTKLVDDTTEKYTKAVKPSVKSASTPGYNDKVVKGVTSIVENKDNLTLGESNTTGLPKSMQEFSDAINQTKKSIFEQYNEIVKQSGGTGASVDLGKVADQLDDVINNKAIQLHSPSAITYAQELQQRLRAAGSVDPMTAQNLIQEYNADLKSFYRNPTYGHASQSAIDAGVASEVRSSLNDSMNSLSGGQYTNLKAQYGSLSTIESDVAKRAVVIARQTSPNLIGQFTNISSGADVVDAITNLNPASFATGAAKRSILSYMNWLNNPDRIITNMFSNVDDALSNLSPTTAPVASAVAGPPSPAPKATVPVTTSTQAPASSTTTSTVQPMAESIAATTQATTPPMTLDPSKISILIDQSTINMAPAVKGVPWKQVLPGRIDDLAQKFDMARPGEGMGDSFKNLAQQYPGSLSNLQQLKVFALNFFKGWPRGNY